jgi:hypothetical protein
MSLARFLISSDVPLKGPEYNYPHRQGGTSLDASEAFGPGSLVEQSMHLRFSVNPEPLNPEPLNG